MATLSTEQVTSDGLNPTATAAGASGDRVRPGSILRVINANAGSVTVSMDIANPGAVDGETVPDKTIAIPTGEFRYIFVNDKYRNKADAGFATVTCSPNASVTIEVIKS